jgi:hypothetical protein
VTCHGNHAVRKASLDLINPGDCGRCHTYERAEKIRGAMEVTERAMDALQIELAGLHRLGFATKALDGELFAARNSFRRLFHTVDIAKVRQETAAIQTQLGQVQTQIEQRQAELARRHLWGAGAITLLLGIGGLALLLHREYLGGKDAAAGGDS